MYSVSTTVLWPILIIIWFYDYLNSFWSELEIVQYDYSWNVIIIVVSGTSNENLICSSLYTGDTSCNMIRLAMTESIF